MSELKQDHDVYAPLQPAGEQAGTQARSPGPQDARSSAVRDPDKAGAPKAKPSSVSEASMLPVLGALVAIAVIFQIVSSNYFLTPRNLTDLVEQVAEISMIALGEVFVLLLAEIDLSLGSVTGLCAAVLAVVVTDHGVPWWGGILLMLAIGLVVGALQGSIVAYLRVPSFMVTLAGLLGWYGVQLLVFPHGLAVGVSSTAILDIMALFLPKTVAWILVACFALYGAGRVYGAARSRSHSVISTLRCVLPGVLAAALAVGVLNSYQGVPVAGVIVLGIVTVAWLVITKTRFGGHLLAVGGNPEAAFRAGVNVRRVRLTVFIIAGVMASIGGLMAVALVQSAGPRTGGGTILLEAIGAAVIGGTSLFGGSGTAWSAIAGGFVLVGISNGLELTSLDSPVKYVVEGGVVLLAVIADRYLRGRVSPATR